MAKRSANEIKVGITVLAALLLSVYIVITLADWSDLFTPKNDITVSLPYDVGLKGLVPGSPIYLGGAKIGQIIDAHIEPPADGADPCETYVYFTMRLPASYPLREDCILAVASNLLGGQSALAIHFLGRDKPLLGDDSTLVLKELDGGISDAMATLSHRFNEDDPCSWVSIFDRQLDIYNEDGLLNNIIAASQSVESATAAIDNELSLDPAGESIRSQIHEVIANIRVVLDEELDREDPEAALAKVRASLDRMNTLLTTADDWTNTNAPVLTETVNEIHGITIDLHDALPGIISQVDAILQNVGQSVDVARAALSDVTGLIGDGRGMLANNRDKIDRIVDDLREVGVNLRVTSREVRRAPWRLLYRPDASEVELESVVETTGRFVAGAERLSDLSTQLRMALENQTSAADQARIQALIDELEETFGHFQSIETQLWQQVNTQP